MTGRSHDSQATIDLAAALADSLEREDDALLLALSGDRRGRHRDLADERRRGDDGYRATPVAARRTVPTTVKSSAELRREMGEYRAAGSVLMEGGRAVRCRSEHYHEQVNPLLRRAVRACGAIREREFRLHAARRRQGPRRGACRHANRHRLRPGRPFAGDGRRRLARPVGCLARSAG